MQARARRLSAIAAVAVLVGAVGLPRALAEGTAAEVPAAPAPAVLVPVDVTSAGAPGPAPTPEGVRRAVGPLAASAPGELSILVVDPATGTVLLEERADRSLIPASTAKLATAAAALQALGPQTRIPTVVHRLDDTLYLVGGGDPTLVRSGGGDPLKGGNASLRAVARDAADAIDRGAPVRLVYDTSAFRGPTLGPGWRSSYPAGGVAAPVTALVVDGGRVSPGSTARVTDPARQAADAFAGFLADEGVTVSAIRKGRLDPTAQEIARVESAPVADIVQRMLTESDNNFADAMAHLTGGKELGKPSFAGGAAATKQVLGELGLDTAGLSLADGSGLSTENRLPVRLLAALLGDVARGVDADLASIAPGLPVAGFTGTLADRFATAATRAGRGYVQAKTGSLTGVIGLSGLVQDRNGRVLVFSMIANNVSSLVTARETMDRIASRLAACGCSA